MLFCKTFSFICTRGTNKERISCYEERFIHSYSCCYWPYSGSRDLISTITLFLHVFLRHRRPMIGVTSKRWRQIWPTLWLIHCSGEIHGEMLLSFPQNAPFKMNSSVGARLAGGLHSNFKGEINYSARSGIRKYL